MIVIFQAYNGKYNLYSELFIGVDSNGNVCIENNGETEINILTLLNIYISTVAIDHIAPYKDGEYLSMDSDGFLIGIDKTTSYMINDVVVRDGGKCCVDYEHGEPMSTADFINIKMYKIIESVLDEYGIDKRKLGVLDNIYPRTNVECFLDNFSKSKNMFENIRDTNVPILSYRDNGGLLFENTVNIASVRLGMISFYIDNIEYFSQGVNIDDGKLFIHRCDKLIPITINDKVSVKIPHMGVCEEMNIVDITLDILNRCYIIKGGK